MGKKYVEKNSIIEKYQVISTDSIKRLEIYVRDEIDKGWQPLGSVSMAMYRQEWGRDEKEYIQAMVKYKQTGVPNR